MSSHGCPNKTSLISHISVNKCLVLLVRGYHISKTYKINITYSTHELVALNYYDLMKCWLNLQLSCMAFLSHALQQIPVTY